MLATKLGIGEQIYLKPSPIPPKKAGFAKLPVAHIFFTPSPFSSPSPSVQSPPNSSLSAPHLSQGVVFCEYSAPHILKDAQLPPFKAALRDRYVAISLDLIKLY
jgi:hypothetical protein